MKPIIGIMSICINVTNKKEAGLDKKVFHECAISSFKDAFELFNVQFVNNVLMYIVLL